jgi:hypothetical protein
MWIIIVCIRCGKCVFLLELDICLCTETCSKNKVKIYVDGNNKTIISAQHFGVYPEDNLKWNELAYSVVMNLVLNLKKRLS